MSLMALLAVSVAVLILSTGTRQGTTLQRQPVAGPKAVDRLRHILRINGNRNLDEVIFDHEEHKERLGGQSGCSNCHHLYKPHDLNSPCFSCHSDMKLLTPIFNHSGHQEKLGGNDSCAKCHHLYLAKSRENSKNCHECHARDMGMAEPPSNERFEEMPPGYKDAMHGLCVTCHQEQALPSGRPELPECDTCHQKVRHREEELAR